MRVLSRKELSKLLSYVDDLVFRLCYHVLKNTYFLERSIAPLFTNLVLRGGERKSFDAQQAVVSELLYILAKKLGRKKVSIGELKRASSDIVDWIPRGLIETVFFSLRDIAKEYLASYKRYELLAIMSEEADNAEVRFLSKDEMADLVQQLFKVEQALGSTRDTLPSFLRFFMQLFDVYLKHRSLILESYLPKAAATVSEYGKNVPDKEEALAEGLFQGYYAYSRKRMNLIGKAVGLKTQETLRKLRIRLRQTSVPVNPKLLSEIRTADPLKFEYFSDVLGWYEVIEEPSTEELLFNFDLGYVDYDSVYKILDIVRKLPVEDRKVFVLTFGFWDILVQDDPGTGLVKEAVRQLYAKLRQLY